MTNSSGTATVKSRPPQSEHPRVEPPRRSNQSSESGFTLVEVMVVVLIIGILLSIGVPTFLGARSRAQDRAAQAGLRTAQTTALIIYTDHADFSEATVTNMGLAEPQVNWVDDATKSSDFNEISVAAPADGLTFGAASMSDSGMCFLIRVSANGATLYDKSDSVACTGAAALAIKGTGW